MSALQLPTMVELARIDSEGVCTFDWPAIEYHARDWVPGCDDFTTCLARLLLAARRVDRSGATP